MSRAAIRNLRSFIGMLGLLMAACSGFTAVPAVTRKTLTADDYEVYSAALEALLAGEKTEGGGGSNDHRCAGSPSMIRDIIGT